MQNYEVKRGHQKKVNLEQLFTECFGAPQKEGEWFVVHFGALKPVKAKWTGAELSVDAVNDRGVPSAVAMETIRSWNKFLESATGFTSKQRSERLQKAAKKGEA